MKKRKILLYGEGKTDYGIKDHTKMPGEKSVYAEEEWIPGPIVYILKNCADLLKQDITIEYADKREIDGKRKIKLGKKQLEDLKKQGLDQGKALPARRFKIAALENGFEAGIFYCDTDKVEKGKNTDQQACKKEFERIYREVDAGLNGGLSARWKGLPMVALKMIECWLLSDEYAYARCFGCVPDAPGLPEKPELIWGRKEDENSNYPKNYMDRVLKQYGKQSSIEIFDQIAQNIGLEILKDKCSISFGKFYEDICGLLK